VLRRRPSPAFVLAFLALLVAMSGVGYAAIPAKDGDVHLCYSKKTGAVQLVDTQSDDFDCERSWNGFVIDSKPTQLVSPNGKFVVEATDTGARLKGPGTSIEIRADGTTAVTTRDFTVNASGRIDLKAAGQISLKGSSVTQNR
jgi:hypothetical protein